MIYDGHKSVVYCGFSLRSHPTAILALLAAAAADADADDDDGIVLDGGCKEN